MNDTPSPIGKLEIENKFPGTDPALMAALASKTGSSDMFGSGGGLMSLLLGAFLFGGRGGLFGAGAAGGDAVAAASITTSKDISAQLSSFQSWAAANAQALATQLCTSTSSVTAAVNALTPQMYQSFAAQAATQAAQFSQTNENIGDGLNDVERNIDQGFAATQLQFQTTAAASQLEAAKNTSAILLNVDKTAAATGTAITSSQFALMQQLAACCCENRLAVANQNALIERNSAALSNQLNLQTCEIKTAISTDGQATRALINANAFSDLQAQLADAKSAARDAAIIAACAKGNGNDK